MGDELSRRLFLLQSCTGLSSAWLAANLPAIAAAHDHARQAARAETPPPFQFLSPTQAADVEAMAAQIIPSDSTPGAREARVIYFIDRALATFDSDKQADYEKGVKQLNEKVAELFPGAASFAKLASEQQVRVLQAIEKTPFFETVRAHTITGFLANPEYGGNFAMAGWKLIGFQDGHAYDPPFGYYDREYKAGG